jgi:ABC-2 type transport system permease protein
MRALLILFRKELRSFFLSPLAYIIVALFMLLNGCLFVDIVKAMWLSVTPHSLIFNMFTSVWFWMGYFFLFPLITMRLFAEERKLGTMETLFTAPVRTIQVLLAKYFATVVLYLVVILPVFGFFLLFQEVTGQLAAFNDGSFFGSLLALALFGTFNIAIGCLASSLTANQLIAAMITFVAVLLHFFFGFFLNFASGSSAELAQKMMYFSSIDHMRSLSDGLIDTRPIVYYVSASILLLFITHQVLDYRKWRA